MGISVALAAVSAAMALKSAADQGQAAEDQAAAAAQEAQRQQIENNRIAQEEKSQAAIQADRDYASMIVGMENIGGTGSSNEGRLLAEIGGVRSLDLARIEGNRKAANDAAQSGAISAQKAAIGAQKGAVNTALGGVVSAGAQGYDRYQTQRMIDLKEAAAKGPAASPLGGSR